MKIVWLSRSSELFGAELGMAESVRALVAMGHEVCAVVPRPGDLTRLLSEAGCVTVVVPYACWITSDVGGKRLGREALRATARRTAKNLRAARMMRAVLRDRRPDVVITNSIALPLGAMISNALGIPHVWFIRELFGNGGHGLHFDYGESLSLWLIDKLSTRLVTLSRAAQHQLQSKISPAKMHVVHSAIEIPPRPARIPDGGPLRLVQVGRLTAPKRPADAIRAVALLAAKGIDVSLTLVGNGVHARDGAELQRLAAELRIERKVEFIPFTLDPFTPMAAADVAVMCSQRECFPRVNIEAMKLGKPVVAADSEGTAEAVADGFNGFRFRMGDPASLAERLEILHLNRALLSQMGAQAMAWATREFNFDRHYHALINVLDDARRDHRPASVRQEL